MKKHIILITIILIVSSIFSSCEKTLDISSLETDDRLVLNCILNNLEYPKVTLSNSVKLDGSKTPGFITNGLVVLESEGGSKDTLKYDLVQECYTKAILIAPGKKYSVYAGTNKFGSVTSSTLVPEASTFATASWKDSTSFDSFGFPLGTLNLKINDNKNEKNFYRLSLKYWNTASFKWEVLEAIYNDESIEQYGYKTPEGSLVFADTKFNGENKSINFETPFGFTGVSPKFRIEIENLNKDAYNYFNSIRNYKTGAGMFQEQTPIYSNILNGIGIFAAGIKQVIVIN